MACSYMINIERLGEVEVYETKQCRVLKIKILYDGRVRVVKHPRMSMKYVMSFLNEHRDEVLRQIETFQKRHRQQLTIFTPDVEFCTYCHRLVMKPSLLYKNKFFSKINGEDIIVHYPADINVETAELQEYVRKVLCRVMKNEAQKFLPDKIRLWAATIGVDFTKIDFRNMKSQWGSCSTHGRICLNIHIVRLPDRLIDFVIIHELCHIIEPNHSPAFHALVNKYVDGKEAQYEKEIKAYSLRTW